MIERRALRIADARSVVIGLALTFVGLAFVAAIVIRIVENDSGFRQKPAVSRPNRRSETELAKQP